MSDTPSWNDLQSAVDALEEECARIHKEELFQRYVLIGNNPDPALYLHRQQADSFQNERLRLARVLAWLERIQGEYTERPPDVQTEADWEAYLERIRTKAAHPIFKLHEG